MTKEELQEKLRNGIYTVTFTKANGEERVMPCTLLEDAIPVDQRPKGTGTKELSEKQKQNLSVYAIESNGWRSFKLESVKSVEPQMVKNDNDSWTVTVQEDDVTDDLILPLPEPLLKRLGWNEGDNLEWTKLDNGNWSLAKTE